VRLTQTGCGGSAFDSSGNKAFDFNVTGTVATISSGVTGNWDPRGTISWSNGYDYSVVVSSTLSVQYFNYKNTTDLTKVSDQCNYYELKDLGRVVPDICCSASDFATANPPLQFSKDDGLYNCAAAPTDPSNTSQPWVRNFLGCVDDHPQFGEICVPPGAMLGVSYPMSNKTLVDQSYTNTANAKGCNCGAGRFSTIYNTTGCVVAVTSYMLGITSDKTATFAKISGKCLAETGSVGGLDATPETIGAIIGGALGATVGAAAGAAVAR